MNLKHTVSVVFAAMLLFSCKTPTNISYFQDSVNTSEISVTTAKEITVKRGDQLAIIVNSKDPALAAMFNLQLAGQRVGASNDASAFGGSGTNQITCYTVDSNGQIDFPILGKIKVENCNRETIANFIKEQLVKGELVKDAIVTVEFSNLYFSVLGEVNRPGRFDIKHDRITLLDAISMAGDLTINGLRENVIVLREEGDKQKLYKVNLTSANDVYKSPVYFLQQKDVVYVEPNDMRKRQSTVNGNQLQTVTFWMSVSSLLMSAAVMVTNLIK